MTASIDQNGRQYSRFWFILTLLLGTFTMSISQSSLSTAYPTLMQAFHIPVSHSPMANDRFYAGDVCEHAN